MITFEHVSKTYDKADNPVLKDLNFHIDRGEFVAIVGPSGCGKTTLINMLMKVIDPSSGRIIVAGRDITSIKRSMIPYYRRTLGVVFQDYKLIEEKNAYDNVGYAMMATGGRTKDMVSRISSIFSLLGITELHNRVPSKLSGGECQKVCMARALINRPQILLCDEPTGNLDPISSAEIFRLLKIIQQQGITVVVATHDIKLAEEIGARIINLNKEEI